MHLVCKGLAASLSKGSLHVIKGLFRREEAPSLSSPYSLHHHLPELGVAEPSVAVGVEPGKDLLDLLLRQVLRELLHLRLGDVAVLVLGEQTHMTSMKFSGFTPLLLVRIW